MMREVKERDERDASTTLSLSPSLSPSLSTTSTSTSTTSTTSTPTSLQHTEWHQLDLPRFVFYMSAFSIVENAVFYPFYILKTREQADRSQHFNALASLKYHLHYAIRTQGIRNGLYRGFWTSSIVSLPSYAVYTGVYTWSKDRLGFEYGSSSWMSTYGAPFLAGILADAASIVLYVPGDVVVQRLQLIDSPYKSFSDACIKIWRAEGYRGFFRGFGATFLTSGVASALWWTSYENSKMWLYKVQGGGAAAATTSSSSSSSASSSEDPGLLTALFHPDRLPQIFAGFIAGTITSTVINPLDVVKTRLQVQDTMKLAQPATSATATTSATSPAATAATAAAAASSPKRYRNVWHGLRQVYVEEGVRGYFRGVFPKLLSRGPLSAMSSVMYELVLYLSRKSTGADGDAGAGTQSTRARDLS